MLLASGLGMLLKVLGIGLLLAGLVLAWLSLAWLRELRGAARDPLYYHRQVIIAKEAALGNLQRRAEALRALGELSRDQSYTKQAEMVEADAVRAQAEIDRLRAELEKLDRGGVANRMVT